MNFGNSGSHLSMKPPRTPRTAQQSPQPLPSARPPSQFTAPTRKQIVVALSLILALVCLTYANHFHNSFHFDDAYAIQQNPYIRDLSNIPLFFKDARTNDMLPANQLYRPLLSVTFTVDYWLGHGLDPLWFHISTFFWYLAQLVLMFFFFRKVFDAARPDPRNPWVALFVTALYGLHPAMAETVNYIMQRADLYSTLATLAGLYVYMAAPALRRYGIYLLPVVAGMMAKQPTAVFPALLFAWIWLFEEEEFKRAFIRSLPAFVVTGATAVFVLKMNAATYNPGGSPYSYRISQPAVLLSYFRRFFLPVDLSADTDRKPYTSIFDENALYGFVFLLLMVAVIFWCRKRRDTRPVSFGLYWFLVTCLPTSWVALAEIENDHRLFFPFVGLAMAVCWAAALRIYNHPLPRNVIVGACTLLLAVSAWGAHERNKVWHTEETLWYDVTLKSPTNGRGLMNYGLSQMSQGRYQTALDYFNRALVFNPYYSVLEINLGVVHNALHNSAEAEKHYLRAIQLAPNDSGPKLFYARWLDENGRSAEAITYLRLAIAQRTDDLDSRYQLMQIYARMGDRENLRAQAAEALKVYPSDPTALAWLAKADTLVASQTATGELTAEGYLNQSLAYYGAGRFQDAIDCAQKALNLKPDYAEAWNNIGAAYNSMGNFDQGIAATEAALRIKPDFQLAKNNLEWARAQKAKLAVGLPK
jgi:uncharacterized protein (TIGR02996 family)